MIILRNLQKFPPVLNQWLRTYSERAVARFAEGGLRPCDLPIRAQSHTQATAVYDSWRVAVGRRECEVSTSCARLQRQWSALFREWDVVLCPACPTPAFRHDHSEPQEARQIEIDGKGYPYKDLLVWADPATASGLPATVVPIERSETGLPIGAQIVGPYLEDRTTIAFAELVEREFGGFVPPPGYAG